MDSLTKGEVAPGGGGEAIGAPDVSAAGSVPDGCVDAAPESAFSASTFGPPEAGVMVGGEDVPGAVTGVAIAAGGADAAVIGTGLAATATDGVAAALAG